MAGNESVSSSYKLEDTDRVVESNNSGNKFKTNFQNKYIEILMTEAANLPVDHGDSSGSFPLLHWVNPFLIREGQAFVKNNFESLMFAHFVGLTIVYSYKPIASVLLRTGGTHVKYNSRMRYLSTILHLKKWYESDLIRKSAKGAQDILSVRRLHAKVLDLLLTDYDSWITGEEDFILTEEQEQMLKALLKDSNPVNAEPLSEDFNTYEPEILMSQLDMVLIQYAFMGLVAISPEVFGIHDRMGLTGFIHVWAVIGTILGIEDRFNLGLNQDPQTLALIKEMIILPCFKQIDEGIISLWQGMFEGIHKFIPLKLKPVLYFVCKDVLNIPSYHFYACMSRYDKLRYHSHRWKLNQAKRYSVYKNLCNLMARAEVHFTMKSFMRNLPNIY